MSDHVAIGKIGHDQVVVFFKTIQYLPGDFLQTHFRRLIEWDTFKGWNEHIVFTCEGSVVPSVEEEGDM
jgi:hypothetical protein